MPEPTAIEVVLYSTVEDNSMIHTRIALDPSSTDYMAAVEEAFYANPLLVNGMFDRVDCLIDTPHYQTVPAAADADTLGMLAGALTGTEDVMTDSLGEDRQMLMYAADGKLTSFLYRTFTNPSVNHRLSPLVRYFRSQSRLGNSGKMYAHFTGRGVDLIVYGRETVEYVNSFVCREPVDAVYYIMAVRRLCGLSDVSDELILSGDAEMRKAAMPLLRRFVAAVMPAIFPSSLYRMGKNALTAPFNMVVLQLTESI